MELKKLEQEWTFIASIPIGYKPCFGDKTLIKTNEWFVSLRRQLKNETGENGVIYVGKLLDQTINYIKNKQEGEEHELSKIRDLLFEGDVGLINLIKTYMLSQQNSIVKGYSLLVEKIEKIIIELDDFLKN